MNKHSKFLLVLMFTLADSLIFGQSAPQLFSSDEPLAVVLRFPFDSVYNESCMNPADHHGTFIVEKDNLHFDVQVRKRGKFRCERRNCPNPPLMINFEKKQVKQTLFNHQNKLKLVMPCKTNSQNYIQCLYKEYLVYKILNSLTPMSFNVKLIDLQLIDHDNPSDTTNIPAFLIEDDNDMALRNKAKVWNASGISAYETQSEHMALIDLFQFMIGNTDWSVTEPHNIELISTNPFQAPFAVPYDFDWCGLVSAPYAVPNPKLDLVNVRQRLFMGYCRSDEEYKDAFHHFRSRFGQIKLIVEQFPHLSGSERRRMLKYLHEFEEMIENPPLGIKQLNRECLEYKIK